MSIKNEISEGINKGLSILTMFYGGIGILLFILIFFACPPIGLFIIIIFGLYIFKLSRQKEDSTND